MTNEWLKDDYLINNYKYPEEEGEKDNDLITYHIKLVDDGQGGRKLVVVCPKHGQFPHFSNNPKPCPKC